MLKMATQIKAKRVIGEVPATVCRPERGVQKGRARLVAPALQYSPDAEGVQRDGAAGERMTMNLSLPKSGA